MLPTVSWTLNLLGDGGTGRQPLNTFKPLKTGLVDRDDQGEPGLLALGLVHRDAGELQFVRHGTARDRVGQVDVAAAQEVLIASRPAPQLDLG